MELQERKLTTADLAAATEVPAAQRDAGRDRRETVAADKAPEARLQDEQLAPLFVADVAKEFRARWDAVQSSFVDDPRQAVRQGDELVAAVMKSLAETFSNERANLEGQVNRTDQASTEDLRIALRRYRSFFERLLSL
jgi:hypothetical protein